jgi:hypothetical protein
MATTDLNLGGTLGINLNLAPGPPDPRIDQLVAMTAGLATLLAELKAEVRDLTDSLPPRPRVHFTVSNITEQKLK